MDEEWYITDMAHRNMVYIVNLCKKNIDVSSVGRPGPSIDQQTINMIEGKIENSFMWLKKLHQRIDYDTHHVTAYGFDYFVELAKKKGNIPFAKMLIIKASENNMNGYIWKILQVMSPIARDIVKDVLPPEFQSALTIMA